MFYILVITFNIETFSNKKSWGNQRALPFIFLFQVLLSNFTVTPKTWCEKDLQRFHCFFFLLVLTVGTIWWFFVIFGFKGFFGWLFWTLFDIMMCELDAELLVFVLAEVACIFFSLFAFSCCKSALIFCKVFSSIDFRLFFAY